jgi:Holliday junction resolvasome RuvABC DNA-binding subunit
MNDAVLALIALGYKQVDALKAVKAATDAKPGQEIPSDELVREALKRLA